jgi:hypothetical protein
MDSQSRRVRTGTDVPPNVVEVAVVKPGRKTWKTGGCRQRSLSREEAFGNSWLGGGNAQVAQPLHYLLKMGQTTFEHRRRPRFPKGPGAPKRRGLKVPKSGWITIQSWATTKDPHFRWVEKMRSVAGPTGASLRSGRNEVWWPKTK